MSAIATISRASRSETGLEEHVLARDRRDEDAEILRERHRDAAIVPSG